MKKKWIALIISCVLTANLWMPATAHVHAAGDDMLEGDTDLEEIPGGDWDAMLEGRSGKCGEKATWIVSKEGTLTIGGSGKITDTSGYTAHKDKVKELIIESGITEICADAFKNFTALKGTIELPESVATIGGSAFKGTNNVAKIIVRNSKCKINDSVNTFSTATVLAAKADSTTYEYAKKYSRQFICLEHKWETVITKEATCTEVGSKTTRCAACGAIQSTEEIKKADHSYSTSWKSDGVNHWYECSVCFDKKGTAVHVWGNDDICVTCKYERDHVHRIGIVSAVTATCEEAGSIAYYKCYDCDSLFEDADAKVAIADKKYTVVKALGHDYNENALCNRCGQRDPLVPEKVDSEIAFVNTKTTKDYTGTAIEVSPENVEVLKGTGEVVFTYYVDEECKVPTFAGTEKSGTAPQEVGIYYVKANISEKDNYHAAEAEGTFVLTIRPRKVASATVVNNKSTIKLSWEMCEEADGYLIYRRKKGTATSAYKVIQTINNNETLSYADKNISQGTGYIYTIRAFANAEDGTRINGLMMSTAKKIVRTKVTSITNQNGSVQVKWTKVTGVAGYKVYRKSSGDDIYKLVTTIKNADKNYYVDKSAKAIKNGKASYYYIKPYYNDSNGYVLTTDKKTNYYVANTAITSVTGAKNALTVKWKKNQNGSGYQIGYSTSKTADSYKTVNVTNKNTLSKKITSLKAGKTYYVKVRAYKTYNGIKYYSAWSTVKSTAKKIVRTKITSITNQNGSVKVKWTKVTGVAGYKVYRKSSGDDTYKLVTTIKNADKNYYVDKSAKAIKNGKASYYYIKPYYNESNGYVLTIDKKTNYYIANTAITSVTGAKNAVTVKWKKNNSGSGYQIGYSTSKTADSYKTVNVTNKNTLSKKITGLKAGKTYYVKVRAYKTYKGVRYYSAWSTVKSVKTK